MGIQIWRPRRPEHCIVSSSRETLSEDRITIHGQVLVAQQKPMHWIGHVSGNLFDPASARLWRDAYNVYAPRDRQWPGGLHTRADTDRTAASRAGRHADGSSLPAVVNDVQTVDYSEV